jgi:AcrR family transcriptional regulator
LTAVTFGAVKRGVKPTVTPQDWIEAIYRELTQSESADFSVDRIARRLGVTRGSFYNYFQSREEALDRTIQFWLDRENAVLAEVASSPPKDLAELLRTLFRSVEAYDHPLIAFLVRAGKRGGKYRKLARRIQEARFARTVETFVAYGVPREQAEAFALYVLSVIVGMAYLEHSGLLEHDAIRASREARWVAIRERLVIGALATLKP